MFDKNPSSPASPTGQTGQPNNDLTSQFKPVDAAFSQNSVPPMSGDLPQSSQPKVMPKPGRTIPGTEDIFAEAEEATLSPLNQNATKTYQPAMPTPAGPLQPLTELPDDLESETSGGKKKFLAIGLAILVVAVIGTGAYFAYTKFLKKGIEIPQLNLNQVSPDVLNEPPQEDIANPNFNQNTDQQPAEEDQNINQESSAGQNSNANRPVIMDSDKDGLTDDEERTYGTDINEPDSDGDGLFDKEEIKVYKTNPLDPDTDADGYIDGDEVKGGYNPNGPGKLLEANF